MHGSGLEHDGSHEIVPDKDEDETKHHRLSGRLAYTRGALGRIHSLVAAHPGDDQAEADRLEHAAPDIFEHHTAFHAGEVTSRTDAQEAHSYEKGAIDADDVENRG